MAVDALIAGVMGAWITTWTGVQGIYGPDNRLDWYQIQESQVREWTRASVSFFYPDRLIEDENRNWKVVGPTYGAENKLCRDQLFWSQPAASDCSGFLISDRWVLTAGHCVETERDCAEVKLVFGYQKNSASASERSIAADNVYSCNRRVVHAGSRGSQDYALIELDRPAAHRLTSVQLGTRLPEEGDRGTLLGYPAGLPLKVTTDGEVVRSFQRSFVAAVDAFAGSSGSPWISDSGELLGILTEGDQDFTWNKKRGCAEVSQNFPVKSGGGEVVLSVAAMTDLPRSLRRVRSRDFVQDYSSAGGSN